MKRSEGIRTWTPSLNARKIGVFVKTRALARQVKLSAMYPTHEGVPFDGFEQEDWSLAVFGVADRDSTVVNERNLDTRPVVTESARAPQNVVEIPSAVGWLCH
jgi:hypothetical protein